MDDIKIELATVLPELIELPAREGKYNDTRPRSSGGNNRFQGNRDNYRPSSNASNASTANSANSSSGFSSARPSDSRGGFSSSRASETRGGDSRPGESRGFRARKKY